MQLAHQDRQHEGEEKTAAAEHNGTRTATSSKWVVNWAPLVLWIGVILAASGEHFAARQTEAWLAAILRLGFGEVESETFRQLHFLVRKGAHCIEYAILGFLLCRAVSRTFAPRAPLWLAAVWLFPCALAATDEFHQLSTPGRMGSVADIGIDIFGAWLGIATWRAWQELWLKRRVVQVR